MHEESATIVLNGLTMAQEQEHDNDALTQRHRKSNFKAVMNMIYVMVVCYVIKKHSNVLRQVASLPANGRL